MFYRKVPEITLPQTEINRPEKVVYAVGLLWLSIGFNVITQFRDVVSIEQADLKFSAILGSFSALLIHSYVVLRIAKGGVLALWLYVLLSILSYFILFFYFTFDGYTPLDIGLQIAQAAFEVIAFFYLFGEPSRRWFTQVRHSRKMQQKLPIRLIHKDGNLRIIRTTFCWSAFLLTPLWAVSERLWRPLGFSLMSYLMVKICNDASHIEGNSGYPVIASLMYFVTMIIFGLHGSEWLIYSLEERGYSRIQEK